jgi:type III secretion protein J
MPTIPSPFNRHTLNCHAGRGVNFSTIVSARFVFLLMTLVTLCGCSKDLYSNLQEREANEMMAILSLSGISVEKSMQADGKFALSVADDNSDLAITILENHGLPRAKRKSIEELFPSKMIATPLEERARYVYSLQQSLEETLTHVDGVITARVHVVVPQNNPFSDQLPPSSASIFLKIRPDTNLHNQRSDIKRIVSNSIEGLRYKDVTLTIVKSAIAMPLAKVDFRNQSNPVGMLPNDGSAGRPGNLALGSSHGMQTAAMVPYFGWLLIVLGGAAAGVLSLRRARRPSSTDTAKCDTV